LDLPTPGGGAFFPKSGLGGVGAEGRKQKRPGRQNRHPLIDNKRQRLFSSARVHTISPFPPQENEKASWPRIARNQDAFV
jgi:hypothetical protein